MAIGFWRDCQEEDLQSGRRVGEDMLTSIGFSQWVHVGGTRRFQLLLPNSDNWALDSIYASNEKWLVCLLGFGSRTAAGLFRHMKSLCSCDDAETLSFGTTTKLRNADTVEKINYKSYYEGCMLTEIWFSNVVNCVYTIVFGNSAIRSRSKRVTDWDEITFNIGPRSWMIFFVERVSQSAFPCH